MSLISMMRDSVDLLKRDGRKFTNLRASVQSDRIFMEARDAHVEPGDLIVRHMSIGAEETFEVTDPGFYERHRNIPARYEMHVRRLDALEAKDAVQHVTFNITGPNARVNQNSIDNSTNATYIDTQAVELVNGLRQTIEALALSEQERISALEIVDAVQQQIESGKPNKTVVSALVSALPAVASITSIASSIVGILK